MTKPIFLLDTNICIYLLGGGGDAARVRVESYEPGELLASAVTLAEIMVGVKRLGATEQAHALFEKVHVVPFDEAAAMAYAKLPFRRGSYDRLIAAHALALDLTLVTNNERDFADVAGLRVENWIRP